MGKMDEIILVAERESLFDVNGIKDGLAFQGVKSDKEFVNMILARLGNNIEVMRRGDAEENPDYKQPIPYVVIKQDNKVYGYKRLSGGGEARLHSQLSLGYGGHANPTDDETFEGMLMTNLERELEEELDIRYTERKLTPLGLINDDINEVGRVHLGLLYSLELDSEATIEVRENDQIEGFWIDIADLKNEDTYSQLETWSQFVAHLLNN